MTYAIISKPHSGEGRYGFVLKNVFINTQYTRFYRFSMRMAWIVLTWDLVHKNAVTRMFWSNINKTSSFEATCQV